MRWLVLLGLVACSDAPGASVPPGASGAAADAGTAATTANPLPACPEADGVLARAAKKLEAELSAAKGTGGIVAVLCNGHITSRPVGSVRAGGDAVKETTRFQFASITKSFTATTALALASAGKVKLGEPITTYVPFVAATYPGARPIALGDLLAHTAGYAVDIPNASYEDDSLEGWFKANGAEKPWSPPGAVFNYSNLGFSLAGLALQRATGTPFGALVEASVFGPTAMSRATMSTERTEQEGDFAFGHSEGKALRPTEAYFQSGQYGPMGGAWGTAADLGAFGKALVTRPTSVLPAAAWEEMETPKTKTIWPGLSYGYGTIIDTANPDAFGHDGSAQGFSSMMRVVRSKGVGFFMVANGDGVDGETMANEALAGLGAATTGGPPPAIGSAADWVGTYVDPIHLGVVQVESSASGYTAQWGGIKHAVMDSGDGASASYEHATYGTMSLAFWRGPTGKVEWLVTPEGHARRN
ncbi:MAG: beta-lactamase family protein [Myxococcales bacterium]|nr:beta-lactamase family protein [Myxococcales bacterium]